MSAPRPNRLFAAASALARAGLRPERPDRLPRAMLAMAAAMASTALAGLLPGVTGALYFIS